MNTIRGNIYVCCAYVITLPLSTQFGDNHTASTAARYYLHAVNGNVNGVDNRRI